MKHLLLVVVASAALAGCVTTSEMPLSPNTVRLDTQAKGILFAGKAGTETQKRAAELTLQKGFTHFRLDQVQTAQGSEYVGTSVYGNRNFAFASNNYAPTSNVGVTVVMFHADEPGAKGAFDAAEVLRSMNPKAS